MLQLSLLLLWIVSICLCLTPSSPFVTSLRSLRFPQTRTFSCKSLKSSTMTLQSLKSPEKEFSLSSLITSPLRSMYQSIDNKVPMLKYLWPRKSVQLKVNLLLSIAALFVGKWYTLQIPFAFQHAIDLLSLPSATVSSALRLRTLSSLSVAIIYYGLSRTLSTVFSEIKTCLFTYVSQSVLRKFALDIFHKMHELGSEFHVRNPSGMVSVAYTRAVRGFQSLLFEIVFSVAPMLIELLMGSYILYKKFGVKFAMVTLLTFIFYIAYTVFVTQWKIAIRKRVVDNDGKRNGYFIDSILNHEVVKLFNRENTEAIRYDKFLRRGADLYIDTTNAIAILNLGQAIIFAMGLVTMLLMAASRVQLKLMSVGEFVAVNAMLMQLSQPFNWLGVMYQEIREALVDMDYMTQILSKGKQLSSVVTNTKAGLDLDKLLPLDNSNRSSRIEFRNVKFRYSDGIKEQIEDLSFIVEPGQSIGIVGPSGSGKSTTLRLMTRLLENSEGKILLDDIDIHSLSLESLRRRISVIPQDTSLFDNTLEYNLLFGLSPEEASVSNTIMRDRLEEVIDRCRLRETIQKLPEGLQTLVGERGARLSGGERQKVAIARALLRNPGVILCDEITSSVDAFAEKEIMNTIRLACSNRTIITVAHRLSSIIHCDKIMVMDRGVLLEAGSHKELLKKPGSVYGKMWRSQMGESSSDIFTS